MVCATEVADREASMPDDDRQELLARIDELTRQLAQSQRMMRRLCDPSPESGAALGPSTLLRDILGSLHETILFALDHEGAYLFNWIDPELERRYGVRAADLDGKTLAAVFPPDVAAERIAETQAMFESGQRQRVVYSLDLPGGTFWHDVSLAPLRNAAGEIYAVLGVVLDITARKQAEGEIGLRDELYRCVVDQTTDWVVIHRQGRVLYANPAARRAFGVESAEQAIELDILERVHPASRSLVIERMRQSSQSPTPLAPAEELFLGPNGETIYGETVGCRVIYQGQPAVMAVVRDRTASKLAEQERHRLDTRIQHAQKLESMAVMAGGVAHDFNNLLAGILGNADLLLHELAPGTSAHRRASHIERAALQASELTGQLLAFAGRGEVHRSAVDLAALVKRTAEIVGAQLPTRHRVTLDLTPGLPALHADATQLGQVVMNLLLNASEALGARPGTIAVRVDQVQANAALLARTYLDDPVAEGDYLRLTVSDDGPGMPQATAARLFDPFFSTKSAGRGLGLAATLGIVRKHAGAIRVDTAEQKGATFEVLLPVMPATDGDRADGTPGS